ncbi:MAG: acyl carrier protein [Gammaproteobacteria bacterium]|nr:acyl carrier protein [Gammaproteobacteria bacterium]
MLKDVRATLGAALQLGPRTEGLSGSTPLLGNLPELDSMAVVTVIAALEERFGFVVDDDDPLSEAFLTLDSLTSFVGYKSQRIG